MPSLKSFRNRITSVKSTQKITKAMQMVAAAKFKRAQEAAEAARPYSMRVAGVVANLAQASAGQDGAPLLLRGTGKDDVHLLVVMTAERGLCGGFNTNIARAAREHAKAVLAQGKTLKILCVGKKGRDQLQRLFPANIVETIEVPNVRVLSASIAQGIANNIMDRYEGGEFDVCTLFYSEFKSVLSQKPVAQQLIPVVAPEGVATPDLKGATYISEPSEEVILETLLPRYVTSQIFRGLLENNAGFFASQMTAMDNATRNAGDLIKKLTLQMNRKRQAMITSELIEIIAGADAV
jgi:F-type H+-transporting ATPase subunit gamma